jgi:hypothetical protein
MRVSGGSLGFFGAGCYPTICQFFLDMDSWGFDPLSGQFVLTPTGSTAAGTWGTVGVCTPRCGYPRDLALVIDMTTAPIAWEGEWFTTGSRPLTALDLVGDLADKAVDIDTFLPVDTIWLHGRGDNAGLTAVLRMWLEPLESDPSIGVPRMTGWVFPTP